MGGETKKRLLLTKWRGELEKLRDDLIEAKEKIESLEIERDEAVEDMEAALVTVMYWFHDSLVHHRPMRDPRVIMRRIEEALS